jgi:hypothetical protein
LRLEELLRLDLRYYYSDDNGIVDETIHRLWHEPALRGDNELTMKQSCLDKVEAEANYGAGQLLFLRQRFIEEALGSAPSVAL